MSWAMPSGPSTSASSGNTASTPTSCSPPGARAAPATRWSTPPCTRSTSSGYMHNRLRMVVASFLVKDLGIDWRRGEAYFAQHLNDFDLAANNGGWQWAASTGCDAQPYFRIFNPVTPEREVRRRGQVHPPLPAAAGRAARQADPRAVAGAAGRPGRGQGRTGQGLPAAGGRPCRGARAHAAALCGGQEPALRARAQCAAASCT